MAMTAATAPTHEIGYQQASVYPWWQFQDETTSELIWPQSVRVYDQMRRQDAQIKSVLQAVMQPVLATTWRIDPNGARKEVVELVADDLGLPIVGQNPKPPLRTKDKFSWSNHLREALLMLPLGHSYFEQVYRVDESGSRAHLRKLALRPATTIDVVNVAADGGLISIQQCYTRDHTKPRPIPVDRLVAYVYGKEGGNWLGMSVLRAVYKNWLLKDRLLRVQAQTIERNGMGIPLYTAQEGASAADIATGLAMAKAWRSGESAGTAVPYGATLSLVGVSGTLPDAEPAVRYHDEQVARAVLAHFLNLGTQTGSWALGTTFADFFTMSEQDLGQQIADTATSHVVEDLVDVNWGPQEPAPKIVFDEIGSRQQATAQAISSLVAAGVIQPDEVLEETSRQQYGLPPKAPESARNPDGSPVNGDPNAPAGAPPAAAPPPPTDGTEWVAASADPDDDVDMGAALIQALAEFCGEIRAAAGPDFEGKHPRGAGGRFRNVIGRIMRALDGWSHGTGPDDPLPESQFTREHVRQAAIHRGVAIRRRASREDIVDALLNDVREKTKTKREAPKPTAKFTLQHPPHAGKDVGVYRNRDGSRVALYEETDAGQRSAHPLESFGSVDELHAWAQDHGETRLADWAHKDSGGKAPMTPSGKPNRGQVALFADEHIDDLSLIERQQVDRMSEANQEKYWTRRAGGQDHTAALDGLGAVSGPLRPAKKAPAKVVRKTAPDGADRPGAVRKGVPRKAAPKPTVEEATAALGAASTRDEAHAALSGLTKAQLVEVAHQSGMKFIQPSLARDVMVARMIELAGGGRYDRQTTYLADMAVSGNMPTFSAPTEAAITLPGKLDFSVPTDTLDAALATTYATSRKVATPKAPNPDGLDSTGAKGLPSGADIEVATSLKELSDLQLMRGENLTPVGRRAIEALGPAGHPRIAAIPDTEGKVREAYRMLAVPGGGSDHYVALADLRKLIGEQASRGEVDATLKQMSMAPDVILTPQSYGRENAATRIPAAVMLGGQEQNLLRIDDPTLARPRQFGAIDMAQELVNRRDGGSRNPMMANISDADLRAEVNRRIADPITARDVASEVPSYRPTASDGLDQMDETALRKYAPEWEINPSGKSEDQLRRELRQVGAASPAVMRQRAEASAAAPRADGGIPVGDHYYATPYTQLPPGVEKVRHSRKFLPTAADEAPGSRVSQAQDRIRAAVDRIVARRGGEAGDFVQLADLRDELGSEFITEEVDKALVLLNRKPGVRVVPESNQKGLSQRHEDAAVIIGDQHKFAIQIEPPADAPASPSVRPEPLSSDPSVREVQVENRIRAAYRDAIATGLTGQNNPDSAFRFARRNPATNGTPVTLTGIRSRVGDDISREELDGVLRKMAREGYVQPWEDQKHLTAQHRADAVSGGGIGSESPLTVITLSDPSPRPLPSPAASPSVRKMAVPGPKVAPHPDLNAMTASLGGRDAFAHGGRNYLDEAQRDLDAGLSPSAVADRLNERERAIAVAGPFDADGRMDPEREALVRRLNTLALKLRTADPKTKEREAAQTAAWRRFEEIQKTAGTGFRWGTVRAEGAASDARGRWLRGDANEEIVSDLRFRADELERLGEQGRLVSDHDMTGVLLHDQGTRDRAGRDDAKGLRRLGDAIDNAGPLRPARKAPGAAVPGKKAAPRVASRGNPVDTADARARLLAAQPSERRALLDGMNLNQTQARSLARSLGITGVTKLNRGDALDRIVTHFEPPAPFDRARAEAIRKATGSPAVAKVARAKVPDRPVAETIAALRSGTGEPLSGMTKTQLLAVARELGIPGAGTMRVADLRAAIAEAARQG